MHIAIIFPVKLLKFEYESKKHLMSSKGLSQKLGVSTHAIQKAINSLVEEGELVFTYRGPSSYVEVPVSHQAVFVVRF